MNELKTVPIRLTRYLGAVNAERGGFTLLSVLIVTAVISSLAIGSVVSIRASLQSTDVELQALQGRTLADAGITRIIAALELPEDPLLSRLNTASQTLHWQYGDADLLLSLESETGRLDLNTGQADFVHSVIQGVIKEKALAAYIVERWANFRRRGETIHSIDALLPPSDRFTDVAAPLKKTFTTSSGVKGIDPMAASDAALRYVPGLSEDDYLALLRMRDGTGNKDKHFVLRKRYQPLLDGERPLYRLGTAVSLGGKIVARREALVAQNRQSGKVQIVFWRDKQ